MAVWMAALLPSRSSLLARWSAVGLGLALPRVVMQGAGQYGRVLRRGEGGGWNGRARGTGGDGILLLLVLVLSVVSLVSLVCPVCSISFALVLVGFSGLLRFSAF
jgi:hypothetical protein